MRLSILSLILTLYFDGNTSAGVIEHDWQTPGDGLLTYDDVSNRQWLDLSVTILDQFHGTTLEDKYQHVVSETLPGGQFEGFSVAVSADVTALAQSARIDTSTEDFSTNATPVNELISLLSETLSLPTIGRRFSLGYLDEFSSEPLPGSPRRLASILDFDPPAPLNIPEASLRFSFSSDSITIENTGVMLFREVVPEPSSSLLTLLLLTQLMVRPRLLR